MLLPEAVPLLGHHIGAEGLHLMVEPGDPGQDICCLFGARSCRFVELPSSMSPATDLDDAFFPEELIIATVCIGMDIPFVII